MTKIIFLTLLLASAVQAEENGATVAQAADQMDPDTFFVWRQPTTFEITLQTVAVAAIWMDVGMSRSKVGSEEQDDLVVAILGTKNPSKGQFFWLGVGATVATTGLWYAMPSGWRNLVPSGIIVGEAINLLAMHKAGLTISF